MSPHRLTLIPRACRSSAMRPISSSTAGLQRIDQLRQRPIRPIAGRHILREIVRPDREERGVEPLDRQRRRRHLDHDAELRKRGGVRLRLAAARRLRQNARPASNSSGVVTMGNMTLRFPRTAARASARSWTRNTSGRAQAQPQAAHAEKRIGFTILGKSRHRLVAAGIEGADRHRPFPAQRSTVSYAAYCVSSSGNPAARQAKTRCASDRCRRHVARPDDRGPRRAGY